MDSAEETKLKLEEIINDLYQKIQHIQLTIGYILEQTNLIPEEKK